MRNVEVIILRVLVIIGLCVAPFLAMIGFKKGRANQSAETVEESKAGNAVTLAPKEDESTVVAETKTLGEELWGDRTSTPIEGVKEAIEPLATILTLGKKKVGDIVFYVIDDYVSEGWFSKE